MLLQDLKIILTFIPIQCPCPETHHRSIVYNMPCKFPGDRGDQERLWLTLLTPTTNNTYYIIIQSPHVYITHILSMVSVFHILA